MSTDPRFWSDDFDEMQRAASNFNGAMDRFERLIERFEAACLQASGSGGT